MQSIVHYSLHFLLPIAISKIFFIENWKKTTFLLWATMLIDLDHLLANPIFQSNRCSIGFHYLHTVYLIPIYISLLFFKTPYRIFGIGLCLHLITDFIDCFWMFTNCNTCIIDDWIRALFVRII